MCTVPVPLYSCTEQSVQPLVSFGGLEYGDTETIVPLGTVKRLYLHQDAKVAPRNRQQTTESIIVNAYR